MFQAKDLKHSNTLLLSHAPCHENVVHLVESFGMALCFFPLEDVGGIYTFQVLHRRTLLRLFLYTVLYHMCFVFLLYTILYNFPFRKIHVVSAKSGRNHTNLRKVVDFGLACQFTPGEVMRQCAGTVVYVAPQAPKLGMVGIGPLGWWWQLKYL